MTQSSPTTPPLTFERLLHHTETLRDLTKTIKAEGAWVVPQIHDIPRDVFDRVLAEERHFPPGKTGEFWVKEMEGVSLFCSEAPVQRGAPEEPDDDPPFVPAAEVDRIRERSVREQDAALFAALAQAQAEYGEVKRTAEVKVFVRDKNYTYTFKYAPLENLLEACVPALTKHGLSFTQPLDNDGTGGFVLKNRLTHKDGGLLEFTIPVPLPTEGLNAETFKKFGSTVTYLRRYCAAPMLGVASEEDDDAGQASGDETVPLPTSEQRRTIRDILKEADKNGIKLDADLSPPETREDAEELIKSIRTKLQEGLGKKNGKKPEEASHKAPRQTAAKRGTPQKVK